jgi:hypothetical protein
MPPKDRWQGGAGGDRDLGQQGGYSTLADRVPLHARACEMIAAGVKFETFR